MDIATLLSLSDLTVEECEAEIQRDPEEVAAAAAEPRGGGRGRSRGRGGGPEGLRRTGFVLLAKGETPLIRETAMRRPRFRFEVASDAPIIVLADADVAVRARSALTRAEPSARAATSTLTDAQLARCAKNRAAALERKAALAASRAVGTSEDSSAAVGTTHGA